MFSINIFETHFDFRWTTLKLGRTPIHSGRTNSKLQFYLSAVVSSRCRTILRMGLDNVCVRTDILMADSIVSLL